MALTVLTLLSAPAMNDDHAADDLRPERLLRPGLRTLDELEQRLGDFSTELSHDEAIELINAAVALAQRARRLQDECFELGLIWTTTNGPLVCGTRRLRAAAIEAW